MKAVVQRVAEAKVKIEGKTVSNIGRGMLILFCVENGDTENDLQKFLKKIINLRIFDDSEGIMNLDIRQAGGDIMVVSQFTLAASLKKGNRPSYINAARPDIAVPVYEEFCEQLSEQLGKPVARGVFGADMKVSLINDGPVTILLDSNLL